MRHVLFAAMISVPAATGCGDPAAPAADGSPGDGDAALFDAARLDGAGGPDGSPAGGDASPGAARILFQCTAFDGGLCSMRADGSDQQTLEETGFVPHGLSNGALLFHSGSYRVLRRAAGGGLTDLGEGAFARPYPDSDRILFQCHGLAGGICSMAPDGGDRDEIRASGRSPDIDAGGVLLFHTDGYHIVRRTPDGDEADLGAGAFPSWNPDGGILFQCDGLGGGLCRMNADGSGRQTLAPDGRTPDARAGGDIVFHTDDYRIAVRAGGEIATLRAGANAVWW